MFDAFVWTNSNTSAWAVYRHHEREKSRAYEQHICEVKHSFFTPLVFSAFGGMGSLAITFYKRLADLLCKKSPTRKFYAYFNAIWMSPFFAQQFDAVKSSVCCRSSLFPHWLRPHWSGHSRGKYGCLIINRTILYFSHAPFILYPVFFMALALQKHYKDLGRLSEDSDIYSKGKGKLKLKSVCLLCENEWLDGELCKGKIEKCVKDWRKCWLIGQLLKQGGVEMVDPMQE